MRPETKVVHSGERTDWREGRGAIITNDLSALRSLLIADMFDETFFKVYLRRESDDES